MRLHAFLSAILLSLLPTVLASPKVYDGPTVRLHRGTFVGVTAGDVEKYLGIPYAKPPVEKLRFRKPVEAGPYLEDMNVKKFGPSCPQLPIFTPGQSFVNGAVNSMIRKFWEVGFPESEDCLSINVFRPAAVDTPENLPVLLYFFGGGFQFGGSDVYDGSPIVKQSLIMGKPVIVVTFNYRVNLFGFPVGKEAKRQKIGNLGLHDQRMAMKWVKKYIKNFGGNPDRIILMGQSAGAMSIAFQMTYDGGNSEDLFHGVFLQSGGPIPIGQIDDPYAERVLSSVGEITGCTRPDYPVYECMQQTPFQLLQEGIHNTPGLFSYTSVSLAFTPRVDGEFFKEQPMHAFLGGRVAKVPFLVGSTWDEGTLFSLSMNNVTTDADFVSWLRYVYNFPATDADMQEILELYPVDKGSPYNSLALVDKAQSKVLTPQYARIAAFQGDMIFQGPKRFFADTMSQWVPGWSFADKQAWNMPTIGAFHGSDLVHFWGRSYLQDYLINFANALNPNGWVDKPRYLLNWKPYIFEEPNMLEVGFPAGFALNMGRDNRNRPGINLITEIQLRYN